MARDHVTEIEHNGFSMLPYSLDGAEIEKMISAIREIQDGTTESEYGVRDLLRKAPAIPKCLKNSKIRALLEPLLGKDFFAVRGLFFNKVPAANWRVAWHQDLTIAVKQKMETPEFGPWSIKGGISHVQASNSLLSRMLALRIHLDDCGEMNGPLKVIPESHLNGKLSPGEIIERTAKVKPVSCVARKGEILMMRPLILHSSSAALKPENRRVIHVELAAENLPNGLEWFEKVF